MAGDLASAIATARASWLFNATVADKNWALRQLHGLSKLLLDNRDEIISLLVNASGRSKLVWERELAITQLDLAEHIKTVQSANGQKPKSDKVHIASRPLGVSLIIANAENIFRYAVAPLAASIAAGNAVVLATVSKDTAFELIQRKAIAYLDQFALHLVSCVGSEIPELDVDHVLICAGWAALLASSRATFVSNSVGYSLAVVPDASIDARDIGQQLVENARAGVRQFDGLDAVFVHNNNFHSIQQAVDRANSTVDLGADAPVDLKGYTRISKGVFSLDASNPEDGSPDFQKALAWAREHSSLLLIRASSMEQAIDGIGTVLETPATTLFASALFSERRLVQHASKALRLHSIEEIRRSYESTIPELKPEHPGGRIDFFVQVEYAVKTVGAVVGIAGLAAAYYGLRHLRGRLL
ncbi:hypothetical protein GQ53DRAFT_854586 [Thozetella sp. PMI_491]|nr:hypothetical protein GQ53DRAFT_854586 [Thozetella sp. PMI_491]